MMMAHVTPLMVLCLLALAPTFAASAGQDGMEQVQALWKEVSAKDEQRQ